MLELARMVRELCGSTSQIVFEPLPVDDPGAGDRTSHWPTASRLGASRPVEGRLARTIAWWRGGEPEPGPSREQPGHATALG